MKNADEILILGAGLAGLTTAYLLEKKRIPYRIIEARDRIGGRVFTVKDSKGGTVEMGATWFGSKHQNLINLIEELQIPYEEQYTGDSMLYEFENPDRQVQLFQLPEDAEKSYRFSNGSIHVIEELVERIDSTKLFLNEPIESLDFKKGQVKAVSSKNAYEFKAVIQTLPPNLFVNAIGVSPTLPNDLINVANYTHTWMGESIKAALIYERSFWREQSIGSLFSQFGPFQEIHDHITQSGKSNSLKGFIDVAMHERSDEERKFRAIEQLSNYFGEEGGNPLEYLELDWQNEPFTFHPYPNSVAPHQYNGDPILRKSYFDGRLYFGGTETSASFPGYMEGAVARAIELASLMS